VLAALPGVPRVVAGGNFATPWQALAVLDGAVAGYRLFMLNAQPGVPDRDGVILESPFIGPGIRGRPGLRYYPCRLSLVPVLLADALPPDVVLVQTTVPADGTVSLGTEVNVLPAALEAVRSRGGLIIAQFNRQVPYTYGDAVLPLDQIDYAIETDVPLRSPAARPVRDSSVSIGHRVAELVPDGATLQLGIGAVPDAVLAALDGRRGLRVWSEMFSDGIFVLHDWMDRNPAIAMLRTEATNDPARIAQRPQMISVNTALEVDLFSQANASRVHGLIYSGFGGQTDFVVGALHSPGGQAIIALPSWHPKADVSTVVPTLAGPVTSFQHSFIVSDQGTAAIWGHHASAQAEQIITQVAHPSARDGLREAGRELGFQV